MSRQCEYCHRRVITRKGAYAKHVRHCRLQSTTSTTLQTNNNLRSQNPLLSLSADEFVSSQDNVDFWLNENISLPMDPQETNNHNTSSDSNDDDNKIDVSSPITTSLSATRPNQANNHFQIKLHDLIMKHKASLGMFDDICSLVNEYTSSPDFSTSSKLSTRKSLIRSLEQHYDTTCLRPKNIAVQLQDNSYVTVPVFDTKAMIIDLLTDKTLMIDSNFAEGYNIFTGEIDMTHPNNSKYGEIHTGDAWLPARNRYCPRNNKDSMPVALVVFGDKSHTDLHGSLALTPLIFTLTLFNRGARNNTKSWRPFGYIPNLSHQRGSSDRRLTKDKLQDEHACLSVLFKSLRDIHREGGFELTVLCRKVTIQVWIHYFIGDTEGNNKWLGQYPGNRQGVNQPYRDCKCSFESLHLSNPQCTYVALNDIRQDEWHKRNDEDKGVQYLKSVSRYDIKNALLHRYLPLSDDIHGPYKMMPPELLHTSGSGLIMYMFESLRDRLGNGINREVIDQQHITISNLLKRQSERDFPRGSVRNGLIDGTKCQSSERKGNLFRLLVIAHRTKAKDVLQKSLGLYERQWDKFVFSIKMYLGMEEWFHDCNDKDQVRNARDTIGKVLTLLKRFFPRQDNTNGYNIPKMHGMTKMQTYITLFGSGINFYGGPCEAAHKTFVKAAGQKTQRRVSEFAKQTAYQYYCMLASTRASSKMNEYSADDELTEDAANEIFSNDDEMKVQYSGRYEIDVTEETIERMHVDNTVEVRWLTKNSVKSRNVQWSLNKLLVKCLHRHIRQQEQLITKIIGYTRVTITNIDTNEKNIFYSHPCYQGESWYDWAMIQFEENVNGEFISRLYPSRILGFISINDQVEAVVQCSMKHVTWEDLVIKFIATIYLGTDFNVSVVVVPMDAIVHPLCVIPDDNDDMQRYFVILPKRNWSCYFGTNIVP